MRKTNRKQTATTLTVAFCALLFVVLSGQAALSQPAQSGGNSSSASLNGYSNNSVVVSSAPYVIRDGPAFDVHVGIDFADTLMGGSIRLNYDSSILEFVSFSFTTGGPEPIISDFTQSEFGAYLSWGWFQGEPQFGVSGVHSIGTLTLIARSLGITSITTSAVSEGSAAGPLVGPGNPYTPLTGTPLQVNYGHTTFHVVTPEPDTGAMLLLGLILLVFLGSRTSPNLR